MRAQRTVIYAVSGIQALLYAGPLMGGAKDSSDYTRLASELGASLPTGAGVSVSQIEAEESLGNFAPNTADSRFAGKTFNIYAFNNHTFSSTGGGSSSHATGVGTTLYGSGAVGLGIDPINVYFAAYWLDDDYLLATDTNDERRLPYTETADIQNHSWVLNGSNVDSFSIKTAQRLDFAIERDNFLCVVGAGVNNTGTLSVDGLMHGYNVLSVGRSDGNHSRGTTYLNVPGRVNPHLVSDNSSVSNATPFVAACGALLIEHARSKAMPLGDDYRVLKALLLAGATKEEFDDWDRTTTRPLDEVYGAGEVNIYNSYHMLDAGAQPYYEAANPQDAGLQGWNAASVNAGFTSLYFFEVPANTIATNMSIALTWAREVVIDTKIIPTGDRITTYVSDLSLRLYSANGYTLNDLLDSSDSPLDNIEHIWYPNFLLPGRYAIEVSSSTNDTQSTPYALAWRTTAETFPDNYADWSSEELDSVPTNDQLPESDPDADGLNNLGEYIHGLNPLSKDAKLAKIETKVAGSGALATLQLSYRKRPFLSDFILDLLKTVNGNTSSTSSIVVEDELQFDGEDFYRWVIQEVQADLISEPSAWYQLEAKIIH